MAPNLPEVPDRGREGTQIERGVGRTGRRIGTKPEVMGVVESKGVDGEEPAQITKDPRLEAHQEKKKRRHREARADEEKGKNGDGLAMESGRKRGDEGSRDFGGDWRSRDGATGPTEAARCQAERFGPLSGSPGMCLSARSKRRGYIGPGLYSVWIQWLWIAIISRLQLRMRTS